MPRTLFTVSRRAVPDSPWPNLSSKPERVTPYLRLSGAWLGRLGFAIGSKVRIAAEPGRLVLELATPAAEVAELPAGAAVETSAPAVDSLRDFVSGNGRRPRRKPRPGIGGRARGASTRASARGGA